MNEEPTKINSYKYNQRHSTMNEKTSTKLNFESYTEEDERLNAESWQYLEDLTNIVKNICILDNTLNKIQELMSREALKKGGISPNALLD